MKHISTIIAAGLFGTVIMVTAFMLASDIDAHSETSTPALLPGKDRNTYIAGIIAEQQNIIMREEEWLKLPLTKRAYDYCQGITVHMGAPALTQFNRCVWIYLEQYQAIQNPVKAEPEDVTVHMPIPK